MNSKCFFGTSKESRPAAGRDRRTWFLVLDFIVTKVKDKTAGRVPQDALLFIQTAIKSKQKGPFSCGGHGIRGRRRLFSPGLQLTWQRLRSTEGQGPQLNKFRWAGLFRRCFVGNAGGENEIFPTTGPGLLVILSSIHPAAPVLATGGQEGWRTAAVGKSDPRRRATRSIL